MKIFFWKINIFIVLALTLVPLTAIYVHGFDGGEQEKKVALSTSLAKISEKEALIYYNEACGMCSIYVNEDIEDMLSPYGVIDFIKKDYVNDRSNRPKMNQLMIGLGVPLSLQSHIMTFIGDKYILGGHVPQHIIDDLFAEENSERFKRIIIYQDKMHGSVEDYQVLAIPAYANDYIGEIKTYPIATPITEYLGYLEDNKDQFLEGGKYEELKEKSLLPTVLISGFLDGLNPCAFAVLLLFIAFLFSIKRGKFEVLKMGVVYISAIYLAYLLIGFGILQAVMFSNAPHFMAKLGAWLVIILGLINIISYFIPKFPIKLGIPHASKDVIQTWMRKATLPAAFVMGFLVGLCTFPCSGGIYVAIIGLLTLKTTYWVGVGYMLLYNLMFILPLIILLALSSNPYTLIKLGNWQKKYRRIEKIIMGFIMVILGLIIIMFFIN